MTWRGYVLLICILALVYAGVTLTRRASTPPAPFRAELLDIVRNPERIRTQRMKPALGVTAQPGAAFFEVGSLIGTGKAIEPSPDWVRRFTDLVTDGHTYSSDRHTCSPTPVMVVRFVRGKDKVDIMVDFQCDNIQVQLNGKPSGTGDFDGVNASFLRLAKEAFPDDSDIQAIQ